MKECANGEDLMRAALKLIVLLLLSFGSRSALSQSIQNVCGSDERATVAKQLKSELKRESLFFVRREDFESELLALQYSEKVLSHSTTTSIACIQIFDVRPNGFRLESDGTVAAVVDVHEYDAPFWRVAFDPKSKKLFELYGFSDSPTGFAELMKDLNIDVASESSALTVRSIYVMLAYEESSRAEVRDAVDVMEALARHRTKRTSVARFYSEWNKCPISVKRQIKTPVVLQTRNGFQSTFYTFVERSVYKTTIGILPDGEIRLIEKAGLFDWSK